MPPAVIGGALAGAGVIGGAVISSSAAKSAAAQQTAAANRAADLQYQMFQEQNALQAPFREAGLTAQNRMLELLGLGGNTGAANYGFAAVPFSQTDWTADPGYAFRLSEGTKALENSAAARGLLKSGASMAGITDYAQGLASQEYQNAFKRYYDEREALLAPLNALRTGGQLSAADIGTAAGNYAANAGNLMMGAANAGAAGRMGAANAWSSALGQGASIFGNYLAYNSMNPNISPYSASSYYGGAGDAGYGAGGFGVGGSSSVGNALNYTPTGGSAFAPI